MIEPGKILAKYEARKSKQSAWVSKALQVRDIYNSDFVLPLPEMDRDEMPAVANLAYQGIEQMSMRIASTMPNVIYPTLKPGIKKSEEAARDRRLVNLAWWDKNHLQLKMQKRARYFVAYAASPVMMRPDFKYQTPYWNIRDPLTTYPAEMNPGDVYPDDCVFAFQRTYGWIRERYPEESQRLYRNGLPPDDQKYEVLEYTDKENYSLVVVNSAEGPYAGSTPARAVQLEWTPNRIGKCWATVPARVTLDRWKGQFDGIIGTYITQAMLMALEVIGMKRAVFAEEWLESTVQGETGKIITQADPMNGIVGVTEGGRVAVHRVDPSVLTTQIVDRLERNIRVETSMPAELGGESSSTVRTGRRGDSIMAASVDFPVQMAQQVFEKTLQCENEIAIAIDKEYFPKSKSFWVSATKGKVGPYDARELWEDDTNFVAYSHAGTDINSLVVAGLQRVGSGTMSKRSFMEMDPMVEDAESEHDRVVYESLELAAQTSLQTMASSDPSFMRVLARVAQEIKSNRTEILDAWQIVDEEMQKQQAAQAQQQPQPPEAAMPGATDPAAAISEPQPSVQNLTSLLGQLKNQSRSAVA